MCLGTRLVRRWVDRGDVRRWVYRGYVRRWVDKGDVRRGRWVVHRGDVRRRGGWIKVM